MITELAEMGVADHVLESINGHLTRRMLEHYSHICIDAKRQALDELRKKDALDRKPAMMIPTYRLIPRLTRRLRYSHVTV